MTYASDSIYGGGGGIYSWLSNATIEHSTISGNTTAGSGGGVYFGGGAGCPLLDNCLVTKNSALVEGGGIVSYWWAKPAHCKLT